MNATEFEELVGGQVANQDRRNSVGPGGHEVGVIRDEASCEV
jgi:hypothetical protein